jgi:hypothetical protein
LPPRHAESDQPVAGVDYLKSENAVVEFRSTSHILDVECGFEDATELRHGRSPVEISKLVTGPTAQIVGNKLSLFLV